MKGKLLPISSLPHSHTEEPCHTMKEEATTQVGYFNPLSEGEQSHCSQARANAQTFYTTIFVVGSNGLVSETSAENQTPFVQSSASPMLPVAEATALDCFSGFVNGRKNQKTSLL